MRGLREVLDGLVQSFPSGYYAWRTRPQSTRARADGRLLVVLRAAFDASRHTYGSPRLHRELRAQGHIDGRHRIARLMRAHGLQSRRRRRFRTTTRSNHTHPVAANVLARRFDTTAPNQAWVSDITYVWTLEGWLYLCVILDLYSRRVIGWSMDVRSEQALTLRALHMALTGRASRPGLVHHSDRGSQYAATAYRHLLAAHHLACSMSRKGNCWDNAVAESFFATLKVELIYETNFVTRAQASQAIFEYLEVFYNRIRRHSYLDFVSPVTYERQHTPQIHAA